MRKKRDGGKYRLYRTAQKETREKISHIVYRTCYRNVIGTLL